MTCKKCGKELDAGDCFCRACGEPAAAAFEGQKTKGYKDDMENTMGHFDGKYMLLAGIILGVLILIAGVVKLNYNRKMQGEPVSEETVAVLYIEDEEVGV